MATAAQITANRRNAQKSTGPVSVAGKAASSMNALRTGIHAKSILLPTESLAELEQLIDEYYRLHLPATPEARALVDDLIYGDWITRRLRVAEAQLWQYDHQECYRPDDDFPLGQTVANRSKVFAHLQWRAECNRRATRQAARELAELEAQFASQPAPEALRAPAPTRTSQATSPQIGFVPKPLAPAPSPAVPNPQTPLLQPTPGSMIPTAPPYRP